jgi:sodium pump decarboxylase gamma subunit
MDPLTLTVIGMLGVFLFLTILVLVMMGTSKLVKILDRYFPEKEAETANTKREQGDDIALAVAAVKAYQNS